MLDMPNDTLHAELQVHRTYLLRVAKLQLRDLGAAEDVVQETLLAAIEGWAKFSGQSSVKTWLTGILKHKIIDVLRGRMRELPVSEVLPAEAEEEVIEAFFSAAGHWNSPPQAWAEGEAALEQKQFFDIMDFCLEKLPPKQGRAFMLREVFELETEEICKALSVSTTNLWVLLHRSRLLLRQCLEQHWFGGAREMNRG